MRAFGEPEGAATGSGHADEPPPDFEGLDI
jgi:hypothetical protein